MHGSVQDHAEPAPQGSSDIAPQPTIGVCIMRLDYRMFAAVLRHVSTACFDVSLFHQINIDEGELTTIHR